ncbi:MAG: glycosyltransferase family 2 protein [Roseivirga sp.]|nr:glycosyltransferase family 2 protein [Roseivirga sp.]
MINGQRIIVVMPAYNAAETVEMVYREIDFDIVDEVVLVDDHSADHTTAKAKELGIKHVIRHTENLGYGGNQKTCYREALKLEADIIIMLHPDYQYPPKLMPAMAHMLASGMFDVVLGSRILGKYALSGGMPYYKYFANRILTLFQNILISQKLSEYHTGYRGYRSEVLSSINFEENSDNFVFDNQALSQIAMKGFRIGEMTSPAHYAPESSSISFSNSVTYGLGVLKVSLQHRLHKWGLIKLKRYQ